MTDRDFRRAAQLLNCGVPEIKAVAEVESSGDGFLSDGRIKILFEGHWFFRFTKGAHAATHPTICYPKLTRQFYAKGPNADVRGARELIRLNQAIDLNRQAGLKSASYGKFQVMGFNFAVCGFNTVEEFYQAMLVSEAEHLAAFCNYIKNNGLADELRQRRWADFARLYNGPEYRRNNYDGKLAAAYSRHAASDRAQAKRRRVVIPTIEIEAPPPPEPSPADTADEVAGSPVAEAVTQAVEAVEAVQGVSKSGAISALARKLGVPAAGAGGAWTLWEIVPLVQSGGVWRWATLAVVVVALGAIVFLSWKVWRLSKIVRQIKNDR